MEGLFVSQKIQVSLTSYRRPLTAEVYSIVADDPPPRPLSRASGRFRFLSFGRVVMLVSV